MKLKDVSFVCVVLAIIVAMVLHHIFSSKRDVIEGTTDGPVTDGPEKCGARHEGARRARRQDGRETGEPSGDGSFPCCLYNAWYDIEDEQRDTIREILPNGEGNLKTDGTWYMPLSMEGQAPTGTATDAVTLQECQQRCIDTPGCVYFNHFPDTATAPQGATCHITDGSEGTQMGENGYGSNPTSHSGRAAQLRDPIPEENRKGLSICKCSADGAEENRVKDNQGGTAVHENALQYGNINKPSEDCNANPRPHSCDMFGNSIATALDTSKATHFRCLITEEVDDDLRAQAVSMGIDVSDFSPTNFQENRELLLNRVTSREAVGLPPNATDQDILAKQEADRQIRVKYQEELGVNFASASETELNQAKLERRSYYRQAFNISEEDLDAAIQSWNDLREQYGLDHSATSDELEEAMRLAEVADEARILRARYGLGPEATQAELNAAIQAYEDIRRQYDLPIDADDDTLRAAIRDAAAREAAEPLYDFTDFWIPQAGSSTVGEYSHTFTNCRKMGRDGPSLSE